MVRSTQDGNSYGEGGNVGEFVEITDLSGIATQVDAPQGGRVSKAVTPPVHRMIIAPTVRVAQLFMRESGYSPRDCRIATRREHLHGCQLDAWETWFLQRAWPCRTHEDIHRMEEMMACARSRGADIRRWWT